MPELGGQRSPVLDDVAWRLLTIRTSVSLDLAVDHLTLLVVERDRCSLIVIVLGDESLEEGHSTTRHPDSLLGEPVLDWSVEELGLTVEDDGIHHHVHGVLLRVEFLTELLEKKRVPAG